MKRTLDTSIQVNCLNDKYVSLRTVPTKGSVYQIYGNREKKSINKDCRCWKCRTDHL